jgi:hypothetical protein
MFGLVRGFGNVEEGQNVWVGSDAVIEDMNVFM